MTRNVSHAAALVELARVYLDIGERLDDPQMVRGAVDMLYNAAEQAAKAIHLTKIGPLPDPSGGAYRALGTMLVAAGAIPEALGSDLERGFDTRNVARFEPSSELTASDVVRMKGLAEALVDLADVGGSA